MKVWSFYVCGHLLFYYLSSLNSVVYSIFMSKSFMLKEHGTMRQAVQKHIGEISNRYREKLFVLPLDFLPIFVTLL